MAADSFGPGTLINHLISGVLVPIDDPIMLAKGIRTLIEDDRLRDEVSKQGRASYDSRFRESEVVERYIKFFQDILS